MQVIVFGGSGGLGTKLCVQLGRTHEVTPVGSADCDITNPADVALYLQGRAFQAVINMAVKNRDSFIHREAVVESQLNVNVVGAFNVLQQALFQMRKQKFGRYIYVSSVLSEKPTMGTALYASAKSFNETMTRVAARENGKLGITCNVIQLGYFEGGLSDRITPEMQVAVKEQIPTGDFGKIEELTKLIEYMLWSSYLNGAKIKLDGGFL